MKGKLLVLLVVVILIFCSIESLADYSFLSLEANKAIEILKEKFREKEIVLEKREGIIWTVILPKNDGVKREEIKEAVYSDETGKFEAIYNFTYITIINAQRETRIVWGHAVRFYPYDIPKLCFVYDYDYGTVLPPSGAPSDPENWYWLPCGDLEGNGSWIQIVEFKLSN